jgi:uncharacterized protein YjbJ (UPF0337 family)
MRFRRNSPTAGEELYEQKETNKPEGSCRRGALGRKEWGKLTDDDLTQINGKREQFEGKIQERYGIAKDQVRKDVDTWLNSLE